MPYVNNQMVRGVWDPVPSDRWCPESHNQEKWFKIDYSERIMPVPPMAALRANTNLLIQFIEAVEMFGRIDLNKGPVTKDWTTPYFIKTAREVIEAYKDEPTSTIIACDIESWNTGWDDNHIICIVFKCDGHDVYIVEIDPKDEISQTDDLNELFAMPFRWLWHNGKFDISRLKYCIGVDARVDEDTMLMHYTGIQEKKGTHGLKDLGPLYLQAPRWDDDLVAYRNQWCRANKVLVAEFQYVMFPKDVLYKYAAMDARATLMLYYVFEELMRPNSKRAYRMLIDSSNAYAKVEYNGFACDVAYINKLRVEMRADIAKADAIFKNTVDTEWDPIQYVKDSGAKSMPKAFSAKSPKQLKWLLEKITGERLQSSDAKTVQRLIEKYPSIDLLQALKNLRKLEKYLGTYVNGVAENLQNDDRVRCSFNLHGTETGRLSCSNPNMQNIPRDSKIKNIFIAAPGYKLVQLDYSQAELRVLAYLSGDAYLTSVYVDDKDLHDSVALQMFGPDFTKEQRVMAKTINFGIAYGRGPASLCEVFNIDMYSAKKLISDWFKAMPQVEAWINEVRQHPHQGIVDSTPFGLERHYIITWENKNGVSNEAVNFPIQSIASYLTMNAVCQLAREFGSDNPKVRIVNNVHDSIVLEVWDSPELIKQVVEAGVRIMEKQPQLLLEDCNVPFKADAEVGYRWGEMDKWKDE